MERLCVLFVSLYLSRCCSGVTINFQSNNKVPIQGNSLQLSCLVDTTTQDYYITWYSPLTSGVFGICYRKTMKCEGGQLMTRPLTADENGSYLNIQLLNRGLDEGRWRCIYNGQGQDEVHADLNVTVYTIPSGLHFTQVPDMNVDLSVTSAQLQCTTSGCTYPSPLIQWLIQGQTASSPYEVYKMVNSRGTGGGSCVQGEQLYTSTLDLQQNITWTDNSDKVSIFSCRIVYPDSTMNVITSGSHSIRFAVRVTEAFLQQNNLNITSTLIVTSGEPVTLTCLTGTSRPAPNIGWYIGFRSIGSGTSLTFTPSNTDHNGIIYCQAYNTDPNLKVNSSKPSLFVRVRVTEAFLQHNNQNITSTLNVTSGEPVNLTCMTGTSRPAPNIVWYIGSQLKGSETSLIFTPNNTDHNALVFCQAYNIDPVRKVYSNKLSLFVRVYVTSIILEGLTDGMILFTESYPRTLKCVSSPSRPMPIIRWFLGNKQVTDNITNSDIIGTNEIHTLTSEIKLVLMRNSSNQTIYCDGFISGQGTAANSTQVIVDVNYAPDVRVDLSGLTEVGSTANLTCTPEGYPPQYKFHLWIHMVGQTEIRRLNGVDTINKSTLTLSNITIQDMGTYKCAVDNSVTGLDGQINQMGGIHVYVQGCPVIGEKQSTFTGEVNKSSSIQIPFYSNTSVRAPKFIKHLDSKEISNTSDIFIYIQPSNITMMLHMKKVMISAHVAVLYFRNVTSTDFDIYTLQLSNEQGNVSVQFEFIPSELPSPVIRDSPVGAVVGGVVGGVVGAIVVVIAIVVAFVIKRRTLKPKMRAFEREVDSTDRSHRKSQLADNPVYDASNSRSGTGIVVVTHAEDPSKVYAQVVKTKTKKEKAAAKGKHGKTSRAASEGKHRKTSRGDIYENATQALKSSAENAYENPGQLATGPSSGDNVYETPEASVSKGQVSKDGLVYADVVLGPPSTNGRKPIIHGLEDGTVYADIDYGKRGKPLPESDKEKESSETKKKNGTKSSSDE